MLFVVFLFYLVFPAAIPRISPVSAALSLDPAAASEVAETIGRTATGNRWSLAPLLIGSTTVTSFVLINARLAEYSP